MEVVWKVCAQNSIITVEQPLVKLKGRATVMSPDFMKSQF